MIKGFPAEIKEMMYKLYFGQCSRGNCIAPIHSFHHKLPQTNYNQKNYPLFINSPFNCAPLCEHCHANYAHEFKYTERQAIIFENWLKKLIKGDI